MKSKPVILIADDDERVRLTLSEILLSKGYKVVGAQNGKEALEKVESESPIVVVTGEDDIDVRLQALLCTT